MSTTVHPHIHTKGRVGLAKFSTTKYTSSECGSKPAGPERKHADLGSKCKLVQKKKKKSPCTSREDLNLEPSCCEAAPPPVWIRVTLLPQPLCQIGEGGGVSELGNALMAFEPLSEKVKRAAHKMDFLIVPQEQIDEKNFPYANVIYALLLLSAGTQKPINPL